jgi:hypothetical protein
MTKPPEEAEENFDKKIQQEHTQKDQLKTGQIEDQWPDQSKGD